VTFKDVLAKQATAPAGPKCSVGVWRSKLSETDRTEFDQAAADDNVGHQMLLNAMKELGYPREVSAIYKHRAGRCNCNDVR
jgi:hypothetical protein